MKLLVYVLYDGVHNTVFEGQVLTPLHEKITLKEYDAIHLITFEKNKAKAHRYLRSLASPITFHVRRKLPFFSTISLSYAARQLRIFLEQFSNYDLIARGPLAGWISLNIPQTTARTCTIQVRGLLAQEYAFSHPLSRNIIKNVWYRFIGYQYELIEQSVFKNNMPVIYHTISQALKEHLINHYHTNSNSIIVTQYDIPTPLEPEYKKKWRTTIRTACGIAHDTIVYCYNGSIKPWQCPDEVITFFKECNAQNNNTILMVLTPDKELFTQYILKYNVPVDSYHIFNVPHTDIFHYLSACDHGIVFRKPHIINWISRPTKILEYQAAGLTIIHNNTIAYLTEQKPS